MSAYGICPYPKPQHSADCLMGKRFPWLAADDCLECKNRREAAREALRARLYQQVKS